MLKQLAEILFNEDVRQAVIENYNKYLKMEELDTGSHVKAYRSELKATMRKIDNLVDAIADGHSTAIMKKLEQLECRKEELEVQIKREELMLENRFLNAREVARGFDRAKQMLMEGSLEATQRLINQYVDKVVIYKEHVEVSFNVLALLWAEKKHNGMVRNHAVALENGGGGGS